MIHAMPRSRMRTRRLVLFTKPAVPGRVKTRLTGEAPGSLTPARAAQLHRAFTDDVADRLLAAEARGDLELWSAWALEEGESLEGLPTAGRALRQEGATLGDRMHHALAAAAADGASVAALGSDHPTVPLATVIEAFERLEAGADAVIGPSEDGGYFLLALAPAAVRPELFEDVAWSTSEVLPQTLERARALGLRVELLARGYDVDTAADLRRLAADLADPRVAALCPRTRALLASWGRLPEPGGEDGVAASVSAEAAR